jgi:hypothetical protein
MVISESFVWAHLPKTGGTTTLGMFKNLDVDLIFDNNSDPKKHHTYSVRKSIYDSNKASNGLLESIDGKDRILGFRRLPSFLLSFYYHRKKFSNLNIDLEDIKKCIIDNATCDELLVGYEPKKIKHWLRAENLSGDFINVMSDYTNINESVKSTLYKLRDNTNNYNRDIFSHFTKEEIHKMYQLSPLWSEYEKEIYGNLIA